MAKFPSPFLNTLYYFSFLTPLKGVLSDVFTFINLPVCVSRFVHNPVTGLKTCDLPLTAPTLALSPIGLFVAMIITNCLCFCSGHSTATHRSFYSYTSVRNRFCSHIYSNCLSHFQNHTFLSWKFYLEIEAYFRYNLFVLSRFGIPTAYPMISGIALQSDAAFYS